MLVLNIIGAGSVAFALLASFAQQRNAALTALRAEQEKSETLLLNILPSAIAERLKATTQMIADHFDATTILFATSWTSLRSPNGSRRPRSSACSTSSSHVS